MMYALEWSSSSKTTSITSVPGSRFHMLELGAGWAKWIVDGVALTRRLGSLAPKDVVAVGVEAQDDHCAWARQHIARNHMEKEATLICGAVANQDGFVDFPVADKRDTGSRYGLGIQMLLDGKSTNSGTKK
eukprot:3309157-Ditylum_brightwellii.AAC.1